MTNFQFTEEQYHTIAEATGFSSLDIQKLDSMGLLDKSTAIKFLIKIEYDRYKKKKLANSTVLFQVIGDKYGLPSSKVKRLIYAKKTPIYYCRTCRKEISKRDYKRYGGICFECKVNNLKLN